MFILGTVCTGRNVESESKEMELAGVEVIGKKSWDMLGGESLRWVGYWRVQYRNEDETDVFSFDIDKR